ncbi:MAG: STAS domain-containing protein [Actinomycetota bacterium]|nr:STAS domain-containing protein [Actinomycetota bacterium]
MSDQTSAVSGFDVVVTTHPGGAVVVTPSGEIDLLTAPRLAEGFRTALGPETTVIVVDLGAVTFFGSAGVAELVGVAERTAERDVPLRIVTGSSVVERVLQISGMVRVLDLRPSVAEALAIHSRP